MRSEKDRFFTLLIVTGTNETNNTFKNDFTEYPLVLFPGDPFKHDMIDGEGDKLFQISLVYRRSYKSSKHQSPEEMCEF